MHVACLVWYAEYSTRFFIPLFHPPFPPLFYNFSPPPFSPTLHHRDKNLCVIYMQTVFAFWQLFCLMQGLGDGVYKYLQILVFF